jgi:hypothetical protein
MPSDRNDVVCACLKSWNLVRRSPTSATFPRSPLRPSRPDCEKQEAGNTDFRTWASCNSLATCSSLDACVLTQWTPAAHVNIVGALAGLFELILTTCLRVAVVRLAD